MAGDNAQSLVNGHTENKRPFLIGVAGGTASGKVSPVSSSFVIDAS